MLRRWKRCVVVNVTWNRWDSLLCLISHDWECHACELQQSHVIAQTSHLVHHNDNILWQAPRSSRQMLILWLQQLTWIELWISRCCCSSHTKDPHSPLQNTMVRESWNLPCSSDSGLRHWIELATVIWACNSDVLSYIYDLHKLLPVHQSYLRACAFEITSELYDNAALLFFKWLIVEWLEHASQQYEIYCYNRDGFEPRSGQL